VPHQARFDVAILPPNRPPHRVPFPAILIAQRNLVRKLPSLALALVFAATLHAQTKHTPSLDESLQLKSITGPRISPDGRFIAYRLREADWKENAYVRQIWLINVATGAHFQLTRGKKSVDSLEWSPDGRWLAFLTERESSAITPPEKEEKKEEAKDEKKDAAKPGKPAAHQLWLISPEGGEAWQLTEHETDISSFHWSKDSRQIAFTASVAEPKTEKDRKEKYSDYEVYEQDFQQNQLWTVDVSAAQSNFLPARARQITRDPALNVADFSWSPDGTRIAFGATPSPLLPSRGQEDIYVADLSHDNAIHKIVALQGPDGDPVFSPDGKQLAFSTALAAPYYYYANGHIAVVDLDKVLARPATQPADVQDLTAKFDEDPSLLDWGPAGIYFAGLQKTSAHLFRLDPKTREIVRITSPDTYNLDEASFTKDFGTMAISAEDATHMPEIYVSPSDRFSPRKLTDMTAQVKDWTLGTVEVVSWKSSDGAAIEGILHKPADYDPSRKYPLLVLIHGGPTGVSQPTLSPGDTYYPIQIFLSKGALVLQPNYRGSAGYGAAFRALNVRNLGVGDMWDVMSGVDSLIARGIADPNKLASMGWSEGGYISAFLTTHTDRFKAISVGAGISDWMTYYVNTDITPFTIQYLHANPWDDPAIYAKTSPISTIKQAKTPTLIQHGSADKRVPPPDGFELYRGLQDQHVPSRLILYTGFGHPITKPKSNRAVMQANLDWFSHYLWNEPYPKDSPILGTSELEAAPPSTPPASH
jgi:dipeptidyl aminopeptidase/acylaminoacyl peptidase